MILLGVFTQPRCRAGYKKNYIFSDLAYKLLSKLISCRDPCSRPLREHLGGRRHMVDPLSAAGLAYPIAKDFFSLAKRLRQAYHEIQHAQKNLKTMINQTETVAETYELFTDTMADAKKVKDLATTFKKHRKLIRRVKKESIRIIKNLRIITKMFLPLLQNGPIDPIQRWITQFQWYRKEKKAVVPLLMEMRILEGSMSLIATLVSIQMLQHSERRTISGRGSIQVQMYEPISRTVALR
jgi:hypothetical protein